MFLLHKITDYLVVEIWHWFPLCKNTQMIQKQFYYRCVCFCILVAK